MIQLCESKKGMMKMAQIADVIKYEGDNSTFVWKHPLEDFNSLSQLIVHESQEAIFFMNGLLDHIPVFPNKMHRKASSYPQSIKEI